jgi:hypothetical protein
VAYETRIVRTLQELERLRPLWDAVPWQREEAEHDYYVTRVRTRPNVIGPLGVLVEDAGQAVGGLAGRIESRPLSTAIGYRVVYAPRVRLLQVVDGGIAAPGAAALSSLVEALESILERREVDAVALPPLPIESTLYRAFAELGSSLRRQHLIAPWTRRRLVLPATFEEFVASRSSNTRWRIRREEKRIAAELGPDLEVIVVRDADRLEQLVGDVDRVARSTYQRVLGAGFSDTPEQRALAQVGLEHGWLRGYLLYHRGAPIAYWLCSVHGETMLIRTAGYDDAWAGHRVGIHLLMRVVEDAIADPALRVLDFGPGDAAYKQQFSSESFEERNLLVFAPTLRGLRINAVRTGVLASSRLGRRVLDAGRLTDRVRSGWRRRLRVGSAPVDGPGS